VGLENFAVRDSVDEAVKWQTKALDSLGSTAEEKRNAMLARPRLYEAKRPFRDDSSP
jgi:hypothetical protein